MRRLDISLIVIRQGKVFFLQKRGNDPKIGASGLIGFFGGKRELNESSEDAAFRELKEEVYVDQKDIVLTRLGQVVVDSDHQLKPVKVYIDTFVLELKTRSIVKAKEGILVKMTKEEALAKSEHLTPGTRACFEELL